MTICKDVEVVDDVDDVTPRLARVTGLSEAEVDAKLKEMSNAGYTPEEALDYFTDLAESASGTHLVVVDSEATRS